MSNSVGRNDNFLTNAQKVSILQTMLHVDIFNIHQHYKRILYVCIPMIQGAMWVSC